MRQKIIRWIYEKRLRDTVFFQEKKSLKAVWLLSKKTFLLGQKHTANSCYYKLA